MALLTQKAFAGKIGKSPQYVNKLVAQGKIVKVGKLIDERQAKLVMKTFARAGRPEPAHRSAKEPRARSTAPIADSATRTLTAARAEREHYQAQTAKLDYELRVGSLLPAAEVLAAERRKNETIRTMLRQLPRSLAPVLARMADPAEVEQRLSEELDAVLSRLARDPLGMQGADAPAAGSAAIPAAETFPVVQPEALRSEA